VLVVNAPARAAQTLPPHAALHPVRYGPDERSSRGSVVVVARQARRRAFDDPSKDAHPARGRYRGPSSSTRKKVMKLYKNLLRAAAFAVAIATSAVTHATTFSTNYTDMWGNDQESGWGLFIDQQADVLLGTLFIYDKFGIAAWYTVQWRVGSDNGGQPSYSGTLYQTSGPALGQPYDPSIVKYREVGQANIEFGDEAHALLTYTIDGAGAVKQVKRLTFAPNSIMGSYIGATQDVTFDCTDPSRNGLVTTDPGPFTITQNQDGFVLKFPTCTATNGVFQQFGQIATVTAIYSCLGGVTGEMKFTGLMSEKGGITGTYTGKDKSCSFRGNVGGMRVME
jgi:hypothetical protein